MTFQVALNHIENTGNFRVENKRLVHEGLLGNVRHYLNASYHSYQISKTISLMKDALKCSVGEHKASLVKLIDAFIVRNGSDKSIEKTLRVFDREIRPLRENQSYLHPANLDILKKWKNANQPEAILHRFPDFAEYLNRSKLLSQIKVTRDTLSLIDQEPAMLVEGKWTKASEIMKRFTPADSKEFKDTFVTDSAGSVYTYLDNGQGLQKCHPFLSIDGPPISTVGDEDLKKVQAKANEFVRPEEASLPQEERQLRNEKRPFVLQVVSSYTNRGDSNLSETLRNARHTYMRLVAGEDMPEFNVKKGHVHEFGFGWKRKEFLPFAATQGRFRSPDRWEYIPSDFRYVTNIPVSGKEADRVFNFTLLHHRRNVELGREIGFQIAEQNCTVFVREAVKQAGVEIPTQIDLPHLVRKIAPDILKQFGNQFVAWCRSATRVLGEAIHHYTPKVVSEWTFWATEKVREASHRVLEIFTAFVLSPISTMLGGMSGEGGEAFQPEKGKIEGPTSKIRNLFDLSSYRYNLPSIMQNWQREQTSTVEYVDPVRLTIVPA